MFKGDSLPPTCGEATVRGECESAGHIFIYMSENTRNRQQSKDTFSFLDMKEENVNEHELQQAPLQQIFA